MTAVPPNSTAPRQGTFAALANPSFAALWAGTFLSNVGAWMHNAASRVFIYVASGNPFLLGLDAFAAGTPMLLMLWGGVLADRWDRRKILITGNTFAAANVAVLAALAFAESIEIWHVLVVSLLNGLINALIAPANQALLPNLVPRQQMSNAVALNSVQFNVARVAGPVLAAVVYATLGPGWCFATNAATFLSLAVALTFIKVPPTKPVEHEPVLQSLRSGGRYLASRPDIGFILIMVFATATLGVPVISMLPALVSEQYGRDPLDYTLLISVFGVGAVIGGLALAASESNPRPWRATWTLLLLGGCEAMLAFVGRYDVAAAVIFFVGMMQVSTMVRLGAATQHAAPDHLRGRIMSFQTLAFRLGQPIGSLLAGALAEAIGKSRVAAVFGIFGGALIVTVLLVAAVRRAKKVEYQQLAG